MKTGIKKIFAFLFLLGISFFAFAQNLKYVETDAVVLQDGCVLWSLNEEGYLVNSKIELPVGSEVKVMATADFVPQIVPGSWISGKTTQTGKFVKIIYVDDIYYVFDGRIAIGMEPGIITVPSAAVYRTRNLADVKSSCLYRGRVLAVGKTYKVAGGISLSAVAYFDSEAKEIRRGYVRSERVSANRDDITAIAMLERANNTSDSSRKRQLISSVKDLNVSGNVLEMIGEAEMRVRRASDLSLAGEIDIPTQVFFYDTEDDYLNIRDMPSTSGNILGTLEYDEDFTVIRKTAMTQTLGGITESWYYGVSSNKIDGWIFGGYLTPRPVEEEIDLDFFSEVGDEENDSSESSEEKSEGE